MIQLPKRVFQNDRDAKFYKHINDDIKLAIDFTKPIEVDLSNYDKIGENLSMSIYHLKETVQKVQENQQNIKSCNFLREAFCIDGECIYLGTTSVKINATQERLSILFELHDTKRGKFYITISK